MHDLAAATNAHIMSPVARVCRNAAMDRFGDAGGDNNSVWQPHNGDDDNNDGGNCLLKQSVFTGLERGKFNDPIRETLAWESCSTAEYNSSNDNNDD